MTASRLIEAIAVVALFLGYLGCGESSACARASC